MSTDLFVNVMARKLLADLARTFDTDTPVRTLDALPERLRNRVVNEARDLSAKLAPSQDTAEAAERALVGQGSPFDTPIRDRSSRDESASRA